MLYFLKGKIARVKRVLRRVLANRVDVVGESLSAREDEQALLALQNCLDLPSLAFAHRNVKYGRALRTKVDKAEE